jgi:hypothetical protein
MNRAIVFVDGENVKVVFGNSVKTTKVSEFGSDQNSAFLDKLFSSFDVFVVSQVDTISRERLLVSMSNKKSVSDPIDKYMDPEQEQQPRRAPDIPIRPEVASEVDILTGKSEHAFLKSAAKTTIIIDDLPTGEDIRGSGMKQFVSVSPGRTLNLGALSQEDVQKSKILRSLMQRKILIPITPGEATRIESDHDTKLQAENDARLDQYAPIIDRHSMGSGESQIHEAAAAHDAEEIDITDDMSDLPSHASNEDSVSMDDLMAQINAAEVQDDIEIVELDAPGEFDKTSSKAALSASREALRAKPSDPRGKSIVRARRES